MYKHYNRRLRIEEVRLLHLHARTLVPSVINASFMVPFDTKHLPDILRDTGQWGRIVQCQLVGLLPSQQIALHADTSIAPAVRFHVPIATNDQCWSYHDGAWEKLEVGRIYDMDPARPHAAVNWGETLRLHVMIDRMPYEH